MTPMAHNKQENPNPLFKETDPESQSDDTVEPIPEGKKVEPVAEEVSADAADTELPEITEVHETKFNDVQDLLVDRFYEGMRYYKGEQWTLAKIKEHSKKLPLIIQELDDLLEMGGIKTQGQRKELLGAVVEDAQHAKNGHEFWHSISDHKTMTAKSVHDRFYRAIVSGLQERESVDEAD